MDGFAIAEVDNGVAWITLNEPARLNPVTPARVREVNEVCRDISARDDVAVAVVTGAGRGFSSGADLAADLTGEVLGPASGSLLDSGPGMWTLTQMRQPVIAMVNGAAVGYGAELAVQADIRIAGTSARFRFPFAELGVVSDTGAASWLLPRLIGWSNALELLYTTRFVSADEARTIGLVNHVVADGELRSFTESYARHLTTMSVRSLRTIKAMVFAGLDESKREHVVEQYFRFAERDPHVDVDALAARFRR